MAMNDAVNTDLAQLTTLGHRLTPATLAHHISQGRWIPARHLLYVAVKLAMAIRKGGARICICMPRRHGKSELTSIWTPTWHLEEWPEKHVILASYGAELATDFGRRVRDTILTNEHRLTTRLRRDQLGVGRFGTTKGGGMASVGTMGTIAGRGADLLLIDDYIKNAEESLSEVQLEKMWQWFLSTAYPALEPNASAIIVATRWNIRDMIGRLRQEFPGKWEIIDLPAEAMEGDVLGREMGEPLWPGRYSKESLEDIKGMIGSYWYQAEYQQQPMASMSELAYGEQLKLVDILPHRTHLRTVRSWDFASQEGAGDWTVGMKMSRHSGTRDIFIEDLIRFQKSPRGVETAVSETAESEGIQVEKIVIEQEPGSAGKIVIAHYQDLLDQHTVKGYRPTGPLEVRAAPFLAAVEAGRVYVMSGASWIEGLRTELNAFPLGEHDDQASAAAQAFNELEGNRPIAVTWGDDRAAATQHRAPANTGNTLRGVIW